ncbi:hypothetical protein KFK09_014875 [Dendrobium nobile]|uniref:Myb/SANT-like domain-containing protein n=1 Tax=Dendrobium nobile TaxID=94219 RepID=A0A8T3B549_DENNO|nr:hypothetical protein KFK09_014875 [Dendrobium nobile]
MPDVVLLPNAVLLTRLRTTSHLRTSARRWTFVVLLPDVVLLPNAILLLDVELLALIGLLPVDGLLSVFCLMFSTRCRTPTRQQTYTHCGTFIGLIPNVVSQPDDKLLHAVGLLLVDELLSVFYPTQCFYPTTDFCPRSFIRPLLTVRRDDIISPDRRISRRPRLIARNNSSDFNWGKQMAKQRESGPPATWDIDSMLLYCDICIKEIELGNRPTTLFNKKGWTNIMKNFNSRTGRSYDRTHLKNKWDKLKKDWKLWKELLRGETGLGWNPIKRTMDSSNEWWNDKLQPRSHTRWLLISPPFANLPIPLHPTLALCADAKTKPRALSSTRPSLNPIATSDQTSTDLPTPHPTEAPVPFLHPDSSLKPMPRARRAPTFVAIFEPQPPSVSIPIPYFFG